MKFNSYKLNIFYYNHYSYSLYEMKINVEQKKIKDIFLNVKFI